MTRVLNLLLIVATAGALILLVGQRRDLAQLQAEHDRLAAEYGALDVRNPGKYLVARVDTDDPHHFAWRVYFPADLQIDHHHGFTAGGRIGGSSIHPHAAEHLHRYRFEFTPEHLAVHLLDRGGGGRVSLGDRALRDFLAEQWDNLDFEILAESETVAVSTDKPLPFLVIRIPKQLRDELTERVGERKAARYLKQPLFEAVYGTKEAVAPYRE